MTSDTGHAVAAAERQDAIRIVPLHTDPSVRAALPGAAPAPPPLLTYRGGSLLASVKVFTVYWGAAWSTSPLADTAAQLDAFFDTVLVGGLMDQLAEYSTGGYQIGHGSRIGRAVVSRPAPHTVVTDTGVRRLLQHQLATSGSGFPAPDANTLYFVYTPPGTAVVAGGSRSCQAFCGYHNAFTDHGGSQVCYAVMPYPGCQGCTGGLAPFDALTATSSHELCEAITDPVPGTGWYDDNHGEIGDICAWQTRSLDGYTVQLEWSNADNACR